ncbi:ribonuclease Z [bacterium]|nr:ribonuclease Z [bacterium]
MLNLNEKDIAVVMLGTGCAAPTLKRRLPSTAIVHQGSIFMFDAGEGTQIQFRKPRLRFSRLETLFISHLHGDHVTGIIGMLMSMELQSRVEPLLIIGPPGLGEFIESNRKMLNTFFSFPITIHETTGEKMKINNEHSVECLPLDHRIFCLGYRLIEQDRPGTFYPERARALEIPEGQFWGRLQSGHEIELADGRKIIPDQVMAPSLPGRTITYCTDTRPCENALILAQNTDLLIYEGTFAAGEEEKARLRGHSTAGEAYRLGQQIGARHVLLTHVSARYNSIADILEQVEVSATPQIAIARDLDTWIIPWSGQAYRLNERTTSPAHQAE